MESEIELISENIVRANEELIAKINQTIIEKSVIGLIVFEGDYYNINVLRDWDFEEIAIEIAKLIPSSGCLKNDKILPVFESAECQDWRIRNNWEFHTDWMWHNLKTGERVTADTLYYAIFTSTEKKM